MCVRVVRSINGSSLPFSCPLSWPIGLSIDLHPCLRCALSSILLHFPTIAFTILPFFALPLSLSLSTIYKTICVQTSWSSFLHFICRTWTLSVWWFFYHTHSHPHTHSEDTNTITLTHISSHIAPSPGYFPPLSSDHHHFHYHHFLRLFWPLFHLCFAALSLSLSLSRSPSSLITHHQRSPDALTSPIALDNSCSPFTSQQNRLDWWRLCSFFISRTLFPFTKTFFLLLISLFISSSSSSSLRCLHQKIGQIDLNTTWNALEINSLCSAN